MSTLAEIQEVLRKNSSAAGKASAEKFVPGSQKVYGVRMPVLNDIAKKTNGDALELAEELWASGAFEERVLAAKLLNKVANKDPGRALKLIEKFSKDISDWAVCDTLGMQSPKKINKSHSEDIFVLSEKLIHSKNPWQRRLAIVLSEWYTRDKKFHPRIKKLLAVVKNDPEYYVKKAIVWINRNFEKKR